MRQPAYSFSPNFGDIRHHPEPTKIGTEYRFSNRSSNTRDPKKCSLLLMIQPREAGPQGPNVLPRPQSFTNHSSSSMNSLALLVRLVPANVSELLINTHLRIPRTLHQPLQELLLLSSGIILEIESLRWPKRFANQIMRSRI